MDNRSIQSEVIFIHSLFRSGSTYFYNVLKRTGQYDVYHEPFHEVIGALPSAWEEIGDQTKHLKTTLRHEFLIGSYFDEYARLLPSLKKNFDTAISFDLFFLDKKCDCKTLKAYIDCLIAGSRRRPIFQCTRTIGRIEWLRENCASKHIFLFRNPWDQWLSYKVDRYISSTPSLIYSQARLPIALKEVMNACEFLPFRGTDIQSQLDYYYSHPITPQVDYFLFFGLWLYAFLVGHAYCDVVIDMDRIGREKSAKRNTERCLVNLGLARIGLGDCRIHRTIFKKNELKFYRHIEEQVFEIFRQHHKSSNGLQLADEYLTRERRKSFIAESKTDARFSGVLEDASRLRASLLEIGDRWARSVGAFNRSVNERDGQIAALQEALTERDRKIGALKEAVSERESELTELRISVQAQQTALAEQGAHLTQLSQVVGERDAEIGRLNQTVTDHKEQLAELEQAVTARDKQITNLNEALTYRGDQIVSLDKVIAEHEGHVASLNEAVAKRDSQIANLNEALRERDEQVSTLNHGLTERDKHIAGLNQALADRDITIRAMQHSHSWRVTAPLRALSKFIKGNKPISKKQTDEQIVAPGAEAFFTICSKNFLAHARVLHNSLRPFYPTARFFVVLCDRIDGLFNPSQEPFEFLYLEELDLPNLSEMAERYSITEFNTAVKPFAFSHLMQKKGFETVVYLDPDILFVDRMQELDRMLADGAEAVLTPHLLQPTEHHDEMHDGKMLLFGVYNLGFLALRNTPGVRGFLDWWGWRLERDCVIQLDQGLFVDQKWADLLPAFVSGTQVIHHPGYNVAYWNLPQRHIVQRNGKWYANDHSLRFVHFSGNKIDDPKVFSRHSQQVTVDNIGDLRHLLDCYREQVFAEGHEFYRKLPYAYSWGGETGVNLHTPEPFDMSTTAGRMQPLRPPLRSVDKQVSPIARIRARINVLTRAVPVAHKLCGGWVPFARRAWRAYRRNGWGYVKARGLELSHYRTPPDAEPRSQVVPHVGSTVVGRLLYLDWAIPKPDQDGGSRDAVLLIRIFRSLGFAVTFVPCGLKYEEGYYEALLADGVTVMCYPRIKSIETWLEANAADFDICFMARGPVVWPYLNILRQVAPSMRLVFYTVDLHYLREMRQAELTGDDKVRSDALLTREKELQLIRECDLTILLSNEELYAVRNEVPRAQLAILPVVFQDIPGARISFEDRRDIAFVGSFLHLPNVDAVIYFVESIFPLIQQRLPGVRFKVVGPNPPERIQCLADDPYIEVLGFVSDLESVFESVRLSVAPLRYGAGIKGKIGSSLCYGVPCVATSIAVEGMGLVDGHDVLVGDTPEAFADAVSQAYSNDILWRRISARGRQFALENYSREVIRERVDSLLWAVREGWHVIENAVEISDWTAWQRHSQRMETEYSERLLREQALLPSQGVDSFRTPGFCCVCGRETSFLTSFMYSTGQTPDGRSMPNWREHMQCDHCGLVNRVRAALNALHTSMRPRPESRIYITEHVTPVYRWLQARYKNLQGSEYFGLEHTPGTLLKGIRHEDLMGLSFADASFDYVLSFDVLEHVPQPASALREIYRVLDKGGAFLFTVPFASNSLVDIVRAKLRTDGSIDHILSPEYHGNPVDPEGGALCFRYFGWELLDELRSIGFNRVRALAYWSEHQGYLGREQYLFSAHKSSMKIPASGP
jgi:glycosyltransferase involved in cell wall biosynthesis/peptidoglycan hydrolase CwlO-like protein